MRHSIISTLLMSVSLGLYLFGCENTESIGGGELEELIELKNVKEKTVCDFGAEALTVGETYSVTVKNADLKVIKEKDLGFNDGIEIGSTF